MLGLSRSIIRSLIAGGFVSPLRGQRREYRFSFQDLVVLRTARALVQAKVPTTRILRSLRRLRKALPSQLPLSGLRVEAVGDAIVVREGDAQWQPDDGQYLLRFHVESPVPGLAVLDIPAQPAARIRDALFERAMALEEAKPDEACAVYRRAIAAEPAHTAAYTNLGRLLQERKRFADAEATYREALARCGADETLCFNLATLLEETKRPSEAAQMFRAALDENPQLADAHYHLALLCEAAGLQQEAIRHFAAFRRLDRK